MATSPTLNLYLCSHAKKKGWLTEADRGRQIQDQPSDAAFGYTTETMGDVQQSDQAATTNTHDGPSATTKLSAVLIVANWDGNLIVQELI